jgi:hypothetical protein
VTQDVPQQWMRTYSTVIRSTTGPALTVPTLPLPSTGSGGWSTTTATSVQWDRLLPGSGPAGSRVLEAGRLTGTTDGGGRYGVTARVTQSRSALEPGRLLATSSADAQTSMTVDFATGTTRLKDVVSMAPEPGQEGGALPDLALDFTVCGSRALGFQEVDTVSAPDQPLWRRERSGVRWSGVAASGTVNGIPVQPTNPTFVTYRERIQEN